MNATWTTRDLDIVETLTRRVSLLTLDQIARIWWPTAGSARVVRRRLRRIAAGGLVACHLLNVCRLPRLAGPLLSWIPGQPDPDYQAVSHRARCRWTLPASPELILVATPLAANLFGSTARGLPPMEHRDHDLLLAEVYVFYRRSRPRDASMWTGECALSKAGYRIKDPDAFLIDPAGKRHRAIESAGRYGPDRIEEFHLHCFSRELPYELW